MQAISVDNSDKSVNEMTLSHCADAPWHSKSTQLHGRGQRGWCMNKMEETSSVLAEDESDNENHVGSIHLKDTGGRA